MGINLNTKINNITWLGNYKQELPYSSAANAPQLAENLQYLDEKIKQTTRTFDYWDIYKFKASVSAAEKFASQFAGLNVNTSMIINCGTFSYNGEEYKTGDVIVKQNDGSALHIKALDTGIFYPMYYKITGNTTTISYGYANTLNDIKTASAESGWSTVTWTDKKRGEINFSEEPAENSRIYGFKFTPSDGTVTINLLSYTEDGVSHTVYPVCKFFDSSNEEVYLDAAITIASGQYTISSIPSIVSYVVVK